MTTPEGGIGVRGDGDWAGHGRWVGGRVRVEKGREKCAGIRGRRGGEARKWVLEKERRRDDCSCRWRRER